jgi:hypothetical protein
MNGAIDLVTRSDCGAAGFDDRTADGAADSGGALTHLAR